MGSDLGWHFNLLPNVVECIICCCYAIGCKELWVLRRLFGTSVHIRAEAASFPIPKAKWLAVPYDVELLLPSLANQSAICLVSMRAARMLLQEGEDVLLPPPNSCTLHNFSSKKPPLCHSLTITAWEDWCFLSPTNGVSNAPFLLGKQTKSGEIYCIPKQDWSSQWVLSGTHRAINRHRFLTNKESQPRIFSKAAPSWSVYFLLDAKAGTLCSVSANPTCALNFWIHLNFS